MRRRGSCFVEGQGDGMRKGLSQISRIIGLELEGLDVDK